MKKCLPSSISNLFKATPSSEGTKYDLSSFILFTTMVMPLGLVGTDLTSDVSVLAQMWHQYVLPFMEDGFKAESTNSTVQQEEWNTMPQKEWTLVFMCFLSMGVLLCSTVSLFKTNQLATLVRGVRTQVLMNSWQSEQQDEPIPLGNLFLKPPFIHIFISCSPLFVTTFLFMFSPPQTTSLVTTCPWLKASKKVPGSSVASGCSTCC